MPPFLLSPTFLKFAGVALLAVVLAAAIGLFVHHYEYLKSQAALVEPLQMANKNLVAQAARDDSRASKAAIDLVKAVAARDQAVADMARWHEASGKITTTLQGISRNANATKNPVCLPTDGERILFNAAVARYLNPDARPGPAGASGEMPAGTR
jgi:hypothetical protein